MKRSFRAKAIAMIAILTILLSNASILLSQVSFPRVKLEELKEMLESNSDIVVIDTQPKGAYDIGHIPGAINLPWVKEIKFPVTLPRDKPLILYCACGAEEDAIHMASQLLERFGYTNVKILEGGWLKWMERGYTVERTGTK
jgi:rhodanese-related sulfurtransferase